MLYLSVKQQAGGDKYFIQSTVAAAASGGGGGGNGGVFLKYKMEAVVLGVAREEGAGGEDINVVSYCFNNNISFDMFTTTFLF